MSNYNPQVPPQRESDLLPYLNDEFVRVSIPLNDLSDGNWGISHRVPDKLRPGVVKYFDGVDADPLGTGKEGLYRFGADNLWHYVDNVDQTFPTPTGWSTITPSGGWSVAGPCVYRKGLDSVQFGFTISGGTITDGTVIFTLPVGHRPTFTFSTGVWTTGAYTSAPRVLINPDGTIAIYSVASGAAALSALLIIPV